MQTSRFDPVAYRRWRLQFPWTDAQIADALDQLADQCPDEWLARNYRYGADRCRAGRVSAKSLRVALPVLVTECFCGAVALVRYGVHGRCRAHKHMVPEDIERYRQVRAKQQAVRTALAYQQDRVEVAATQHHTARGLRRPKAKK